MSYALRLSALAVASVLPLPAHAEYQFDRIGEYDAFVDNEWDSIINFPENMFAQSMALTMSCGGTCFLWEAPVFSMAVYGNPVAGYEYAISPLLDAVIAGEIKIPSREQVLAETKGTVEGIIVDEPAGENGFGYDPVFFVPALGQTVAQLPDGQKNAISHRGNAIRKLIPLLDELLAGLLSQDNH